MKVLQLGKFFPPDTGGIESVIGDLTNELAKEMTCDVLCSNSKNKTKIENARNHRIIRTASLARVFSTSISPSLFFWLKRIGNDYDVIHLHLPDPMATAAYFLARPRARLVLHWHSDIVRPKALLFLYDPLQYWILRRADRIIATSPRYVEGSKYLKKHRGKISVVPLGLDTAKFTVSKAKVKEIRDKSGDRPIIFSLGRLIYYKGYEYLIEAMKDVGACLLIGGCGPLGEKLQRQAGNLNIKRKIYFLGEIKNEDLGSYYRACDVFCLPSVYKSEAFGLVQVEAMFFGKPVVSTDIEGSGVGWVNRNGVTGITVPPRDSGALAAALNGIIGDPGLREKLAANGKRTFEENFTIKMMAEKITRLYKEILSNN